MAELAIRVEGLTKHYGEFEAVAGLDLAVPQGEVFAFLGPNGAGKTTTTEILEGYRPRSGGQISVLGQDPERGGAAWRARIGIVLQTGDGEPALTPRETLELWTSYYPRPRPVDEVLELVGLSDRADDRIGRLSGGQRRRVEVGLALIGNPELIFLDEPTTGFDPDARRQFWSVVSGLRDLGTTVFLTTHYMEEAQALADRVAIIKSGRIIAEGTPATLGRSGGGAGTGSLIAFRMPDQTTPGDLPDGISGTVDVAGRQVTVRTDAPTAALSVLTGWAAQRAIELPELTVRRASLEDIYLELTR